MANYHGSALVVNWIYSGGTVALTGDFRNFSYEPSVELIETTAGADAAKTFIRGVTSGKASFEALMQSKGTALTNSLAEGTSGTLIVGMEGTVATYPKMTLPAISMGVKYSEPYNDTVTISVDFEQNGVRVDGVF